MVIVQTPGKGKIFFDLGQTGLTGLTALTFREGPAARKAGRP
jgi:hypothetical protein